MDSTTRNRKSGRRRQAATAARDGNDTSYGRASHDKELDGEEAFIDDDEGEASFGAKRKENKMYEAACPVCRFFSNPCLFCWQKCRKGKPAQSQEQPRHATLEGRSGRGGRFRMKEAVSKWMSHIGSLVAEVGWLLLALLLGRKNRFVRSLRVGRRKDPVSGKKTVLAKQVEEQATAVVVCCVGAGMLMVLLLSRGHTPVGRLLRRGSYPPSVEIPPILIPRLRFADVPKSLDVGGWLYESNHFPSLSPLGLREQHDMLEPDFGELVLEFPWKSNRTEKGEAQLEHVAQNRHALQSPSVVHLLASPGSKFRREIDPNDHQRRERERKTEKKEKSPRVSNFYAADDDDVRSPYCRRVAWHRLYNPNCNMFHELDLSRPYDEDLVNDHENHDYDSFLHSHGYYRDVWMVEDRNRRTVEDSLILKTLRWKHEVDFKRFETVRMDALIMERLTASPRIIDIYGHCATSVAAEVVVEEVEIFVVPGTGYAKREDLGDEEDVKPRNEYSPTEKLEMSLAMAESLADLHGFEDGIIVHDDVQLCQWLRTHNGTMKLGDFNRAEVMLWDEKNNVYCRYTNGEGFGNYRSPEEFAAGYLDQSIDVFSLGNNMYALLTGLWVFYEYNDDEAVQKKLIDGETSFIDDRYRNHSFAESKLVEIIEKCWTYEPSERISIFDVVEFLRVAVKENQQRTKA